MCAFLLQHWMLVHLQAVERFKDFFCSCCIVLNNIAVLLPPGLCSTGSSALGHQQLDVRVWVQAHSRDFL